MGFARKMRRSQTVIDQHYGSVRDGRGRRGAAIGKRRRGVRRVVAALRYVRGEDQSQGERKAERKARREQKRLAAQAMRRWSQEARRRG